MRRTLPRVFTILFVVAMLAVPGAATVSAQEQMASASLVGGSADGPLASRVLFPVAPVARSAASATTSVLRSSPGFDTRRPAILPALYVSVATLQALDAHSTMTALGRGGREANPLMRGVAGNRGAMLAVKAGVAGSTIYLAEKMWKRNRVGAIAMMAIVNVIDAAVVAHNYRVARNLR
jgi:hypothetical protein